MSGTAFCIAILNQVNKLVSPIVPKNLNNTIRPEDDPFVEHFQTPAILEILY
jgi:hypothetical protein